MGSDIPTNFDFPTLIKVLLPGIICSVLFTYLVLPLIPLDFTNKILQFDITEKIIFWLITGMIFGMIISSLDKYIYRLFMGTGILPNIVLNEIYCCLLQDFNELESNYETKMEKRSQSGDSETIRRLTKDIVDMSNKFRSFPFNSEKCMTYPSAPTRLGNVIMEYESYSEVQYGMSFNVFWSRIWQIMPIDSRKDVDVRGARADFLTYLLFLWIVFFPFMLYNFYNIICIISIVIFTLLWMISAVILYDIAISAHESYGGYVKASFDINRVDLARKLNISFSLCPRRYERNLWKEYGEYLGDYDESEEELLREQIFR